MTGWTNKPYVFLFFIFIVFPLLLKNLNSFFLRATPLAIRYWHLPATATMRDMLLAVRADEGNHRDVNHDLSELPADAKNPYAGDEL